MILMLNYNTHMAQLFVTLLQNIYNHNGGDDNLPNCSALID